MNGSRSSKRRLLGLESLESRIHPDGKVAAFLNRDGDLIVQGDNDSNFLVISRPGGPGSPVQVAGVGGTSVNGVPNGVAVIGSVLHVDVQLGHGDDGVRLDSLDAPGIVHVKMGNGNDSVDLDGIVGGAVELHGGPGDDSVEFSKETTVFGFVQLAGGEGDDQFFFRSTAIGGRLDIVTGEGNDYLDLFRLEVGETADIRTGEGDDYLILDHLVVASDTQINLGSGDDGLYLDGSDFMGPFFADAGGGTDDIDDRGGNTFGTATFRDFES